MKKCFLICSVLVASLFLFSCANSVAEYGTITLSLPGSNNRAAVTVSELSFNVEVTNQDTSEVTTQSAGAGETCSIDLPKGMYTVKVEAYKAAKKDQILFTGSKTDVEIIPGKETPVSLKLKSVYEDVEIDASVKITTITKGNLMLEVMGYDEITLTVKSLGGKAINSCSWLINGVPAKNETTPGMITQVDPETGIESQVMGIISVITINENTIILDLSRIDEFSSYYHLKTSSDDNPNNTLSCIVEFEDGNMEDISYTFTYGA